MLEERYGKFTKLKLKLSRLSYTAVEYFPFSIVISISICKGMLQVLLLKIKLKNIKQL